MTGSLRHDRRTLSSPIETIYKAGWTILLLQLSTSAFKLWSVNLINSCNLFQRHSSWSMQLILAELLEKNNSLKDQCFCSASTIDRQNSFPQRPTTWSEWIRMLTNFTQQKEVSVSQEKNVVLTIREAPNVPNFASKRFARSAGKSKSFISCCTRWSWVWKFPKRDETLNDGKCLVLREAMTPKISKMGSVIFILLVYSLNLFSM